MHLPALGPLARKQSVAYVGVCDLYLAAAQRYASALAQGETTPSVFADIDEMLRQVRPDGVLVLVPPEAASTAIERVGAHRIPFLTEKPPAPDTVSHRRLIDRVGDLPHIVAYNRRHSPYVRQAKAWMDGRSIQSVTVLFSRYQRREPDFTTTAVHAIDTAWYLAGGDLATVRVEAAPAGQAISYFVSGWTRTGVRLDILMTPDTASAIEHYIVRSAARTVVVSYPQLQMMDVPGYVELHEQNRIVSRMSAVEFGIDAKDFPALGGILGEQETFCKMLRGEVRPDSTLAGTLQTQQVREALRQLLDKGGQGVVELDLSGGSKDHSAGATKLQ